MKANLSLLGGSLLLSLAGIFSLTLAQTQALLRDVREPAIIVVEPSSPTHTQGGKLSLTCVAYGEPQLPTIIWSAPSLGVNDFQDGSPDPTVSTNISTSILNDTDLGLVFVISTLELCNVNYTYSFVDDFSCTATNGMVEESTVGQRNYSSPFSMQPLVYEPASLLASPSQGQFVSNGPRISVTCAAYGSPRPAIMWTQDGSSIVEGNFTNIYTESVVDRDGDILVLSTLELCEPFFMAGPGRTACTAINGVVLGREQRVQTESFVIDPRIAIERFVVQLLGDTAEFTITFSSPVILTSNECFFHKLFLASNASTSDESLTLYQPLYPGLCQATNVSNVILAYLDPRDFRPTLAFFEAVETLNILSVPDMELGFLPLLPLLPIQEPLGASALQPHLEPRMESFDVDHNTNRLILHFTDYMDLDTLNPSELVLTDPVSGNMLLINASSVEVRADDILVRTVCITLESEHLDALQTLSICSTIPDNCACFFSSDLIATHRNISVQEVLATLPLPVSKLKFSSISPAPQVYLQVSLQYAGCMNIYNLTTDEVYVLRMSERVTRIECFSSGVMGNINPVLSFDEYEGPLALTSTPTIDSEYITFDWLNHRASIAIPEGLPPLNYGLYTCSTENTTIQHYLINLPRYLSLPDGPSYAVRLYDPITIPFVLGSDPFINLLRDAVEISLIDAELNMPASIQPLYRKLSPYRGEIFYNLTQFSQTGQYSLRVSISGDIIASASLNLTVNRPQISVIPPVVTVLPSDTRITLQCVTNSPALPVEWLSSLDSTVPMGTETTLTLNVPPQGGFLNGETFYCVTLNPESDTRDVVGSDRAVVQNIEEELEVQRDGVQVEDFEQIVENNFGGELLLQCLSHTAAGAVDLMWVAQETGQDPMVLLEDSGDNYISVSYEYNVATVTINNVLRPFRGTLRCRSATLERQITVFFTESQLPALDLCSDGNQDALYGIAWGSTAVNTSDSKPCPLINGRETMGTAFRMCLQGSVWDNFVNVSNCQSSDFRMLKNNADILFSLSEQLSLEFLNFSLSELTNELVLLTAPNGSSLFPLELNCTNYIVRNTILQVPTSSLQANVFDVIDNILEAENIEGWQELDRIGNGSSQLLENIENFGVIYLQSPKITGKNLIIGTQSTGTSGDNVRFPEDSDLASSEGQLIIPAALLNNRQAGVATALIRNLPMFLPQPVQPQDSNKMRVTGSVILSARFASQDQSDFLQGLQLEMDYRTIQMEKAVDPKCMFWNVSSGSWDERGVDTVQVGNVDTGEIKSYDVKCTAGHATAFAVILDVNTEEFNFTIPVYVGCGVVILGALLSIFFLLFSCLTDRLRKYVLVSYFSHMSVCVSLICAFVGFLAGLELALENEIGCVATAAILHYFFTAAFSWILCDALVLIFYPFCAKHCGCFLLVFLIGWILPAIPTAITLELLRDDYVTSQFCWFFFDGTVENTIVLSFIVPKLILIAASLLFLMIGCITAQVRSCNLPKAANKKYIHLLRFMWFGELLLLALLSLTWVISVLLVNVYGLDSVITGWVFMGACIALSVWLFLFNMVLSIQSQWVDYEGMWQAEDTDHGGMVDDSNPRRRAGEYEMMPASQDQEEPVAIVNPLSNEDYEELDEDLIEDDLKEDLA